MPPEANVISYEDEDGWKDTIRLALENSEHTLVQVFQDPVDVLAAIEAGIIEEEEITCLMLDGHKGDGGPVDIVSIARAARAHSPAIGIVVFNGFLHDRDGMEADAPGFVFLGKANLGNGQPLIDAITSS